MHPIEKLLKNAGRRLLLRRLGNIVARAVTAITLYLLIYFTSILTIKSMSLTWGGLLLIPAIIVLVAMVALPLAWWRLRNPRLVAQYLEGKHPALQLSLRSSLDFLEGKTDVADPPFREAYVHQVAAHLSSLDISETRTRNWGRYAFWGLVGNLAVWLYFQSALLNKFYHPSLSFGQTHLDLSQGSITIFEPEYTQIPGRTLPLKPGTFATFPGSKIRFLIELPPETEKLYLAEGEKEQIPLRINEEHNASFEFVLLENREYQFLLAESKSSGRTDTFRFEVKTDEIPEILLRSYTPEGPLNVMDPLLLEAEVKDDFGIKELQAVVTWADGEKRINIDVPANRKKHFITRNQWFLSDFEMDGAESFSIYLEAKDNNPINGPGIGVSPVLTYELESPEKKYDEFMEIAKQLLDTMAHTLGDNLETEFASRLDTEELKEAEALGKQISNGLYRSLSLTNNLISKVRETPNLTRLDQNFLFQFRNGVSKQARARTEISLMYSNIKFRKFQSSYQKLMQSHGSEELKVEGLTYELLLQLKMWAIFELERKNSKLQDELEELENLLENSENMDDQELMDLFNKLMDEVMKDFQEMMSKAAQQMEKSMEEFMNSEAMQEAKDSMQELREQIMEALKNGDMEKAKKLMQELRAQMEAAFQSMQQQMGEMSPEMQAMMKNMRELMGLLKELKSKEESLEMATQKLKQRLDEEMGNNGSELGENQKQEFRKATQRIHDLLSGLYNKLVEYKTEDLSQHIIEHINQLKAQLDAEDIDKPDYDRILREIGNQERLLDFLARDGLDRLQSETLRNLEQTEKMQEYLDQGELMLSLESGFKLESSLVNGERLSERTASHKIREEARPKETFREARTELYKILDALQNMKSKMEEARRRYMESKGLEDGQKLAQSQAEINQMIQEFLEKTEDSFGGSQIAEKLMDIGLSMKNSERKLGGSRLEGGIHHEQQALQKIGEMMEQLQQSSQPSGGRRPFSIGRRQTGNHGDPSLEDIFIPESEKKANKDRMKEQIRKRLEKNLPEAYGKEIRRYYESLMDQ